MWISYPATAAATASHASGRGAAVRIVMRTHTYSHTIERVKDAIDMVDLVGAKTELKRSGQARMEGLCPFHDERTPSFGIDPVQKVYHCFGCGVGGDAITFVRETEQLTFAEAVEALDGDRREPDLQFIFSYKILR